MYVTNTAIILFLVLLYRLTDGELIFALHCYELKNRLFIRAGFFIASLTINHKDSHMSPNCPECNQTIDYFQNVKGSAKIINGQLYVDRIYTCVHCPTAGPIEQKEFIRPLPSWNIAPNMRICRNCLSLINNSCMYGRFRKGKKEFEIQIFICPSCSNTYRIKKYVAKDRSITKPVVHSRNYVPYFVKQPQAYKDF